MQRDLLSMIETLQHVQQLLMTKVTTMKLKGTAGCQRRFVISASAAARTNVISAHTLNSSTSPFLSPFLLLAGKGTSDKEAGGD